MRYFMCAMVFLFALTAQAAEPARGLDIYFVDVEGGAATLIVTPTGESVLIDCGFPGTRDADRIHKAATELAGLKAIDHFAVTHWHTDHYGGIARLSKLMPVKNFYNRGVPNSLQEDPKNFPLLIQAYKEASQGKFRVLKPGDEIPLQQVEKGPKAQLLCLCSAGEVVPDKAGAPENPIAKEHKPDAEDKTDNAKSLGFILNYGDFRFLDLGDLTWNVEYKLVHPTDKIGKVDVYQVTHHGTNNSSNPVLVKTVAPRVAIFNNGPRKGGHPSVLATLRRIPDIQAIYQVHRNVTVGSQENSDPEYIANIEEKCQGEPIKLSIAPDGKTYAVTVRGKERRYETRSTK